MGAFPGIPLIAGLIGSAAIGKIHAATLVGLIPLFGIVREIETVEKVEGFRAHKEWSMGIQ